MSEQSYEIVCPVCKSVMPSDAPRCANCAAAAEERARTASAKLAAVPSPVLAAAGPPAATEAAEMDSIAASKSIEGASTLKLKDYHRLVRSNYGMVEQRGASAALGKPLVPIMLIVALGLIIAAALALHWV
jgi:hypothetical protein